MGNIGILVGIKKPRFVGGAGRKEGRGVLVLDCLLVVLVRRVKRVFKVYFQLVKSDEQS
jgi:hypothetical protein